MQSWHRCSVSVVFWASCREPSGEPRIVVCASSVLGASSVVCVSSVLGADKCFGVWLVALGRSGARHLVEGNFGSGC